MNRIALILALSGLLVASIGTAGLLAKRLYDQRRDFAAREESLRLAAKHATLTAERREAALVDRLRRQSSTTTATAAAQVRIAAAAASAPDWAATKLPREVLDALR